MYQPPQQEPLTGYPPRGMHQPPAAQLFESVPDAMLVVDRDGMIKSFNAHLTRLFGYREEELVDQAVEVFLPERLREQHLGHR